MFLAVSRFRRCRPITARHRALAREFAFARLEPAGSEEAKDRDHLGMFRRVQMR